MRSKLYKEISRVLEAVKLLNKLSCLNASFCLLCNLSNAFILWYFLGLTYPVKVLLDACLSCR
jgi:hypothetical protein